MKGVSEGGVSSDAFAWGLDIARSLADAGGVGALLQVSDHASGKSYLPAYDGNGNIAHLSNATTGALAAVYEYTPFGKSIRTEILDSALTDQPFRFSTKWTDDESGLLNFGRRYYEPRNGRFVGRDPISEEGGLNLYAFCRNNSINRWDILGMIAVSYNGQKIDSSKLLDGVVDLEDGSDEDESKLSEFLTDDEIAEKNKYNSSGSEDPSYGSFGDITVLDVIIIDSGGGNVAPNNTVTVNTTTFIPQASITDPLGATYMGDGRNLWDSGTHRSSQTVIIDPRTGRVVSTTNDIGTSVRLSPAATGPIQSTGSFRVTSSLNSVSGITTITMTGSVTNNAFIARPIPSPSIDYTTTITVFPNGSVAIQTNHDGFPGYEVSVNGQHTYGYDPRATGTGPGALWGDDDVHSKFIPVKLK